MRAENDIDGRGTPPARPTDMHMSTLMRLDDMDDYEVASGDPDPRGWDVKARDGQTVGTVKQLLVDPRAMRVRYLEVELNDGLAASGSGQRVHVPVARARLRDDTDDVIVDLGVAGFALLGLASMDLDADPGDGMDHARFFGQRRAGRADAPYLVLRERRY